MDIRLIDDAIEDLLESDTTRSNAEELAALIVVQDYLQNRLQRRFDATEAELNDVLPQYRQYKEVKRKYQRKEVTDDCVLVSLKLLCKEIQEFMYTLYHNTDMLKERILVDQLIVQMQKDLKITA